MKLVTRDATIEFPRRPLVMGIVNLCVDSFSGDGFTEVRDAFAHAERLIEQGADIIDIGAESAGTQRRAISEQEETDRLCEFIESWNSSTFRKRSKCRGGGGRHNPQSAIPLSINTWRPAVARVVLALGGDILNDIGALPTDENARTCAVHGAALVIMHSVGEPKIKHTGVRYEDVMASLEIFFAEKIALAEDAGLSREAIILDPGIDFAKQRADNLRIYRELSRLDKFARPILLPVSRKTVIGEVLDLPRPADRDAGTVACIVNGILRGAHILRVHDVRAAAQTVQIMDAVERAGD